MATCLQEKYYPTENFLASLLGCRPSFLWHNLLEGRNHLLLGLRHRIDNGQSTHISHDMWIPTLKEFSPSSFHLSNRLERKVFNLIDYNQCCLRKDKIWSIFLHYEAKAILEIPLTPTWLEDLLIWNFTTNGQYMVKFSYNNGIDFLHIHTTTNIIQHRS